MLQETSAECAMYTGGKEDCSHLFLECPFAHTIWASQSTSQVNFTSAEVFCGSLIGGAYRRDTEEGRLFAVLQATTATP